MAAQFNASEFTASKAKPLPVVLLLDTSGSMYGDKIRSLNDAVRKMLGTFRKEESQANQFLVSIITFGGTASLAYSPAPASELAYASLGADGGTPLGAAIGVAKSLIEDREQTPSRAYRPLVVLVSDGVPTDSWESELDYFIQDGRSAKCDRMALGIGHEAYGGPGRTTLERFIAGTGHQVFEANDAGEIHNFFRFVTMSVVSRSLSQNPNEVPKDSALRPPQPAETPKAPAQAAATATDEEDGYW
jgi:uncharacterized protein YegL